MSKSDKTRDELLRELAALQTRLSELEWVEEALRESEALRHGLFNSVPIGLYRTTPDGRILEANQAFVEMLGYPDRESLVESSALDLYMDPNEHGKWRAIADREGVVQNFEARFRRRSGAAIWVKLDVRVTRDAGGQVMYYEGVIEDITERKHIEKAESEQQVLAEALRDTAAALSSTLEFDEVLERILSNAGKVVPHDAANVMLIESGISRVVGCRGYPDSEHIDRIMALRFVVADTPTFRQMADTRQPLIIPDTQRFPGWVDRPETRWVRSYVGVPISLEGEVAGFINLNSARPDAFTPTHAESLRTFADQAAIAIGNAHLFETVRATAGELEARTDELAEFGSTVAHDLKSPLQLVLGFANLLNTDYTEELNEETLDILRKIETNAIRMNQIIDSLLLLATIGSAEGAVSEIAIGPVVDAALARLSVMFDERGIAVDVELPRDLPTVIGHGPWLEEVFANLMENAAKYIGAGNPAPHVIIRGCEGDGCVRFEVEDNGMGIAADVQDRLFKPGERFHSGKAKGHGLGLSIVWRIIRKLNGEVGVESTPGEGSTFWFTLPAAR